MRTNRRISLYTGDLVAEMEGDQYKEALEDVVNTQWQVYRCSPLWNVKWKEREVQESNQEGVDTPPNIRRMAGEAFTFQLSYECKTGFIRSFSV